MICSLLISTTPRTPAFRRAHSFSADLFLCGYTNLCKRCVYKLAVHSADTADFVPVGFARFEALRIHIIFMRRTRAREDFRIARRFFR